MTAADRIAHRAMASLLILTIFLALGALPLTAADRMERDSPRVPRRPFDAVHAVTGKAFGVVERPDGTVSITWLATAAPTAEAYGLSPDGKEIVYMPLDGDFANGELWRERLDTHVRSRIASATVVAAAVGPSEPFTVGFTTSAKNGAFTASVVNVRTGAVASAPSPYVMPDFIDVDDRGVASYFEEDDPLLSVEITTEAQHLRAAEFDAQSRAVTHVPSAGQRRPYFPSAPSVRLEAESRTLSTSTAFAADSRRFEVLGDTLLGETALRIRDRETDAVADIGSGVLLDVLQYGVIVRRITPNSTHIEYVTREGKALVIGTNATVTFTLPLASSVLTQSGEGYSGSCGIMDHKLNTNVAYAYDFQGPSSAHVYAVAPGSVVSYVTNVTCNNYDTNGCPIYVVGCAANGGWGNTVIYRLSDGTFVKSAHHSPYTFQTDATNLCAGRYYAQQGSTGKTVGNLEGCGAHVHIQRQASGDLNGVSSAMYFAELGGTAGTCLKTYASSTREVSSCTTTKVLTGLSISGPSSVNENASASYAATATWSDGSSSGVVPTWSENSSYTTISTNGVLTAATVTANQSVTVTASYSFGGVTKTATEAVTVMDVKVLTALSISGPSSVNENASASYAATATWSDGSSSGVVPTWSENSSYTTISTNGVLTAATVTANQSVTVTASYSFGGVTKTATKAVTVMDVKVLTALSISGPSSVNENASASYAATATWSDGSSSGVVPTWSENSSYTTISTNGVLTAVTVTANQSVTVTASYSFGGVNKTSSKVVIVVNR